MVGSTCSLVWERRTTCWVTMRVPDPNIPIVRRPLPVREGRDLDHHVTACGEGAGVRGHAGGGGGGGAVLGLLPAPFLLGGGAAKGLLPCFLVPKGDQPTACTLALWWLKFGPTRLSRGGGGGGSPGPAGEECRADVPLAGLRLSAGCRGERGERGGGSCRGSPPSSFRPPVPSSAGCGGLAGRSRPEPLVRPVAWHRAPLPAPWWLRGVSRWRGGRGGGGGLGPHSGGRRPAGGYPGPVARTSLPPPFPPLGARLSFGPSPTVPPLPASPSPRRVALARAGRGGSAVSDQWSAGQWGSCVVRVRVPVASAISPTGGGACPLALRTAGGGGGGGRSWSGGLGLLGGCTGALVRSQTPVFVAWGPGSGLPGVRPLPLGVAFTCAYACVGAGVAAAAGSSGGSASG